MTDAKQALKVAERLNVIGDDQSVAFTNCERRDVILAASLLFSLAEENERLRSCVVSFLAPWAVRYADDFGLPKGHLHASHYDLLAECGARMDDFTRHPLTTHPAQPEGEGHDH